ncbi:MAG: DUF3489 domain-containing protein [Pseudomonadota bacterium]
MIDAIESTKPAKRVRRMAREPKQVTVRAPADATPTAAIATKPASKTHLLLHLLQKPEGATIAQLAFATDWLPHTTRAALTGLKKKGHSVTSSKESGVDRVYNVAAG